MSRLVLVVLLVLQVACGSESSELPTMESPQWERLDTLAVLGGGPTWTEPPFYQVSDAVLDNERDIVFLVNGGDAEIIRYDIGSGQIRRIGRRGAGPGEFHRPLWMEPYGPDSLLVYDRDVTRFSVFSRSGRFGRHFRVSGTGLGGKQATAVTQVRGAGVWVAISSGLPQVLLVPETPPGTKERDTLTVIAITDEGHIRDTIARVPHALWERLPDSTSFNIRRDWDAGGAMMAGGGGRLFLAAFGDSLEVFAVGVGSDLEAPSRDTVAPEGMPRHDVSQVFAGREGSLWIATASAGDSTVFHVFEESPAAWARTGTFTLHGTVRILDAAQDRAVFSHRDQLGRETILVAQRVEGSNYFRDTLIFHGQP